MAWVAAFFDFLGVFFSAVGMLGVGYVFKIVDAAGILMGAAGAWLGIAYAISR
jgi:hypothetical protein